ncbi:MAG: YigZ family protein [Bacteroidales bacterium]|nr:YigZ family protein [Bacteroidales bacterium]
MKTSVRQIESNVSFAYHEKNSRFIGLAFPIYSEKEAQNMWNAVRKKYYKADHFPYAYIIGVEKEIQKSSDDGEPSGTAGKPILNVLLSKDLTYTMVVVVRYFGGIKLGTSGLKNAFKTTTQFTLESANVVQRIVTMKMELFVPYQKVHVFYSFQQQKNFLILEQDYQSLESKFVIAIPISFLDELKSFFSLHNFFFIEKEIYLW